MTAKPSVILIRESEQQLSGSGCCGRLEGDLLQCGEGRTVFADRRAIIESMGPLYRSLRAAYGDSIEIQVVDPRNVGLIFMLVRDFWVHRVGVWGALKTLARIPVQAVVVNGRLVARGEWPAVESVATILDADLERGPVHAV